MASKKVPSTTGRSANFSPEEVEMILDEMFEFPQLASGSFSARFPTKEHLNKQWKVLADKLTSSNMGIQRSETQVRGKWHDLKYRVKQKNLKHKQFMNVTGGGPGEKTPYTSTDLRIIGLIGLRCVEGISDETCDTTALTLQNLKKKKMTSDLLTDGNASENNADNSDYNSTKSEEKKMTSDLLTDGNASENNADNSDYMTIECEVQSESSSMIEEAVPVAVATPVTDQENGEIIRNTQQATPKTSWPVRKSSNSSTKRGQKHRERKRKRTETELENFESTALEMQKNMCQQVTNLAESVAQVVPTVSSQQDILISINNNIQALLKKIDQTNKLLALVLNADEEFAERI